MTAEPLCRDHDPEDWFPLSETRLQPENERAVHICLACPLREPCLEMALALPAKFGIWGGLTSPQREKLAKRVTA